MSHAAVKLGRKRTAFSAPARRRHLPDVECGGRVDCVQRAWTATCNTQLHHHTLRCQAAARSCGSTSYARGGASHVRAGPHPRSGRYRLAHQIERVHRVQTDHVSKCILVRASKRITGQNECGGVRAWVDVKSNASERRPHGSRIKMHAVTKKIQTSD